MFDTPQLVDIETHIKQFPVPMFAVERSSPEDDFRFLHRNQELQNIDQPDAGEMTGQSAFDIWPLAEARRLQARFEECCDARGTIRFRDVRTTAGHEVIWDTTLQYFENKYGADRLVGTTVALTATPVAKDRAFEDIRYMSAVADMQLQNLINLFESFRNDNLFSIQNEQRVSNVSRLCRTVQAAVSDITRIVRNADTDRPGQPKQDALPPRACSETPLGSDTLKALRDTATRQPTGLH